MKVVLIVLFSTSFVIQIRRPDLTAHGAALGLVTNLIWLLS